MTLTIGRKQLVTALIAAGIFGAAGFLLYPRAVETKVPVLAKDEIVIVRTPGGKLQVATLRKNEEFAWQTTYTCPIIQCDMVFKPTISKVRVPVHYTYTVALASRWTLKPRETYLELRVPKEEPNLPPAIDIAKLQIETNKGWLSPNGPANEKSLLKQLGPELNARAIRPDYIAAQRDAAGKTVAEFARKWMVEQGVDKQKVDLPIKIIFAGEVH